MKDIVSELLRRQSFCIEQNVDTQTFVQVFDPLFEVVSSAAGASSKVVWLSKLVSAAILATTRTEAVKVKELVKEVAFTDEYLLDASSDEDSEQGCESQETDALLEGFLFYLDSESEEEEDAKFTVTDLNDDCLQKCLSFVSFKDRVHNVEFSCRRLFHLSRQMPLTCGDFNDVLTAFPRVRLSPWPLAVRFHCEAFTLPKSTECDIALVDYFSKGLTKLTFDSKYREILDMSFPRLQTVHLTGEWEQWQQHSAKISAFLLNHAETTSDLEIDAQIRTAVDFANAIARLKSLRALNLRSFASGGVALDYTHIDDVCVNRVENIRAIGPLLHGGLKRLRLYTCTDQNNYSSSPFDLPQLCDLTLTTWSTHAAGLLQRVAFETDSRKLTSLSVSGALTDLPLALKMCPFGTLDFELSFRNPTDERETLESCQQMAWTMANKKECSLKKLTIRIHYLCRQRPEVVDFCRCLTLCGGFLPPTTLEVRCRCRTAFEEYTSANQTLLQSLQSLVSLKNIA